MCRGLAYPLIVVVLLTFASSAGAATDPDPADGATGVATGVTLFWSPFDIFVDVYFGTDRTAVEQADSSVYCGRQHERYYYPGPLEECTTHYWRIDDIMGGMVVLPGPVWSFTTAGEEKAHDPEPADGAINVESALLRWTAGCSAVWHDVYLGTSATLGPSEHRGRTSLTICVFLEGFAPCTTYYWRIDEVEADETVHTGDVWHFRTAGEEKAHNPDPPDGATGVFPDVELSWSAGCSTSWHEVYFGTEYEAVASRTGDTHRASQDRANTTYDPPGDLAYETQYFWCIDEVVRLADGATTTYAGDIWDFETEPLPLVTKATNPRPADGAPDVPADVTLGWTVPPGTEYCDVYLGTDSYAVAYAGKTSPYYKGRVEGDSFDVVGLVPLTPYFWRIDVTGIWDGVAFFSTGDLWGFTTGEYLPLWPWPQEQKICSLCECENQDILYDMHISVNYGVVYTDVPVCQVHSAEGATIDLRLHYDSGKADGSIAKRKTVLGLGWTHNYNIHLIVAGQDVFMPDATGRMTRFQKQPDGSYTPSDGQTHTLSRIDSSTFLLEEVDGTKRTFELFDPAPWPTEGSLYQLTQIEDAQGRVTTLSYNIEGLLESVTDPYGRQVALDYNGQGLIENITNADGAVTQIEYTDDNLSQIIDPLGYTLEYTYDGENRMTTEKQKGGNTWTCVYNSEGKPYQLIDGDGQVCGTVTNSHNWAVDEDRLQQFGELRYIPGQTMVIDGEGNITYCDYDENGYITHAYEPNHPGTIDEFDDELRLVRRTDEEGNQWLYDYDAYGNRIRVTDPLGNETEMFYEHPSIPSLMTKKIEPDGDQWLYAYDGSGNLTTEIDPIVEVPDDKAIAHTYNALGLRSSTTDRNGNITEWQYNGDGTLARQTVDPGGLNIVTEYEYDTAGRKIKQTLYRDPSLTDAVVTTYDHDAMGRLVEQVLDPGGLNLTTQYEYNGAGRTTSQTNPRGIISDYEYNVRGRLIKETVDPGGLNLATRYEYDNADNQTKLIDPKGNETTYEYDDLNRLVKTIDAEGYWTLYQYDERGNQSRQSRSVEPGGPPYRVTEYRYDELGRRTHEIIDPCDLALTTEFEYALPGSVGCACGTPGSSLVHKTTDPAGKVTYYYYDQLDRINSQVRKVGDLDDNGGDGDDAITAYEYDNMGNRTRVTVENDPHPDMVTTYDYDAADRLVEQVLGPGGSNLVTIYAYDGAGNTIERTTPEGNVIVSIYDKAGRLISQSDSIGEVASHTHDENGNTLTETDGLGHTWSYAYDNADRQIAAYDPLLESPVDKYALYEYDENGSLIRQMDNEGLVTEYTYDALDRRIETTQDPCGLEITITQAYDGLGNLVQITDDNGNATAYDYDAANRKVREVYADGTDVSFEYDAVGNLVSRTDQMENLTTYICDDLDRLIMRIYADGRADTFTYDRAGRMLTADNDHSHIGRDYDDIGRVIASTQTDLPETYSYTVSYDYNTVDNTRTITYPSGKQVLEVRDVRNRLIEVWQDGTKSTWYTYDDPGNRVLTKNHANGTHSEYAYNDNDWVTGLRHIGPDGRTFAGFAHEYDAVGNRLNAINLQNVLPYDDTKPVTQSEMYGYDSVYRLVDFKRGMSLGGDIPWPTRDRTWQLDGVHNWTQFSIDGQEYSNSVNQMNEYDDPSTIGPLPVPDDDGVPDDFMADARVLRADLDGNAKLDFMDLAVMLSHWLAADCAEPDSCGGADLNQDGSVDYADLRIFASLWLREAGYNFAHDKNGNLIDDGIKTYEYDYENRLTGVMRKSHSTILGEYRYDALGRRINKYANEVTIVYLYDGDLAIEERIGGLAEAQYVYGRWIDDVLTVDRGSHTYYYRANSLGSITALTDALGHAVERYAYDAYGKASIMDGVGNLLSNSAVGNPYLFTGRRLDEESGLYYCKERHYSSERGRFQQRDPMLSWISKSRWMLKYLPSSGGCEVCEQTSDYPSYVPKRVILGTASCVHGYAYASNNPVSPKTRGQVMIHLTTGGRCYCNVSGGPGSTEFPIIVNNDECSNPCTWEHEEQHKADMISCCRKARQAYNDASEATAKNKVVRRWNKYVYDGKNWLECQAYGKSVSCAEKMYKNKNCDCPEDADKECCNQIKSYRDHVKELKDDYCGRSGAGTAPTCPW